MVGLPFLQPQDVGDCFAFDLGKIQPNDAKITAFADYLVNTYKLTKILAFHPHCAHNRAYQRIIQRILAKFFIQNLINLFIAYWILFLSDLYLRLQVFHTYIL